jgi:hypothetical protein
MYIMVMSLTEAQTKGDGNDSENMENHGVAYRAFGQVNQ